MLIATTVTIARNDFSRANFRKAALCLSAHSPQCSPSMSPVRAIDAAGRHPAERAAEATR